jgi:hypothetical protein
LALQKAAMLPPGKGRDAYIARLRADAERNLDLIAERLEREAGASEVST